MTLPRDLGEVAIAQTQGRAPKFEGLVEGLRNRRGAKETFLKRLAGAEF